MNKPTLLVLVLAAVIFFALFMWARPVQDEQIAAEEYAEYERATVTAVLGDNTEMDPASDNAYRGEQMLSAKVMTGQYKGEELMVYNYTGPLYGVPVTEGDSITILISTHSDGQHNAVVYEYNRIPVLAAVIIIFCIVTILIGGRTGLKSLIGLIFTIICLFMILIPMLLKGAPTIPATFLMCGYISLVSFTILGGIHRKTISAFLGTFAGTAFAMVFGIIAQSMARVSGLRITDVEPLLQLRQTGTPIGLRGLLVAGIIISALGAVMDVSMSISSALEEVHQANPKLSSRQLFRSGMNIGRDMAGTMTNTLILAFLGSSFTLTIYLYSLGLSFYQLFSSAYASIEIISGISSSIGMILTIPLTAIIASALIQKTK
ncbi:MAG: YibE/F family protein [Mogibacterium sp.]|nr:YibE/F family protein [Mogibacterium sp.]